MWEVHGNLRSSRRMLNDVYAPSGVVPPQKSAGKWLTLADWIVTNYEENAPAGAEQSKAALQQAKEMAIQCVRPTCASDMLMHHLHSSFFCVFAPASIPIYLGCYPLPIFTQPRLLLLLTYHYRCLLRRI